MKENVTRMTWFYGYDKIDDKIYFARVAIYRYLVDIGSCLSKFDGDIWTVQHSWTPVSSLIPEIKFARLNKSFDF